MSTRSLRWIACALALSGAAAAQEGLTLERPGHGLPVCGLGTEFHAGRRAALRERLKQGVVVVRGLPATRGYERFEQDKVFWYLTGVDAPGAALVMDAATGKEVLLVQPRREHEEIYEGDLWDAGDPWVSPLTGIEDVRAVRELEPLISELAEGTDTIWISMAPWAGMMDSGDRARKHDQWIEADAFDGRPTREQALRAALYERYPDHEVEAFDGELAALRRVKQPEELDALRRAGRAGAVAMTEAIRSTRPGLGEWDIEALMSFLHVREGALGPAYHAIVGSGPNSLTLHHSASNRALRDGDVLLVDFGCELDHYTTDITRTWPVNGVFSERQAGIYDAVLEAQQAGLAVVKPGNTVAQIEAAITAVYEQHGMKELRRHGSCHLVGMEVHDAGRLNEPLVPGVVLTVEPGIYDYRTGIGVRIEDVVAVTADGHENLTALVPKERAAIEALIAEEGLLDRMDGLSEED